MDFQPTDEQAAIRDLADQVLGDRATSEALDALDDAGDWFDRETWKALAETGLLGACLPEADGGGGLGLVALHHLLHAVGTTAAYVPVWETLVLGALPLARFGTDTQRELLAGVASGEVVLTAALAEDGRTDELAPTTSAVADGDGWTLTGTKSAVPVAADADQVLVSAATDDGRVGLFLVDPSSDGVTITPQQTTTPTPHGLVTLDGASAEALGDALDDPTALAWLVTRARAGLCSMAAGNGATMVRMAAEYTTGREQFGRPIATFQAVGQRLADAHMDVLAIELTALQAMWLLDAGRAADDEVAIAKFWAADGGNRVVHATLHVHGGVGVDTDYPLHRFFRNGKRIEFVLGNASDQLADLGTAMATPA